MIACSPSILCMRQTKSVPGQYSIRSDKGHVRSGSTALHRRLGSYIAVDGSPATSAIQPDTEHRRTEEFDEGQRLRGGEDDGSGRKTTNGSDEVAASVWRGSDKGNGKSAGRRGRNLSWCRWALGASPCQWGLRGPSGFHFQPAPFSSTFCLRSVARSPLSTNRAASSSSSSLHQMIGYPSKPVLLIITSFHLVHSMPGSISIATKL